MLKLTDYDKYYIQGSDHYLIPKDAFIELFNEMSNWREEYKKIKEKYENIILSYKFIKNRMNQGMIEKYKNECLIELGNNILKELEKSVSDE